MYIKNKKTIGLLAIIAGSIALYFAVNNIYKYFNTMLNGVHTNGTIVGYKRINNTGKGQPTFEFTTVSGQTITARYKTSLPNSWNNSMFRYFKTNDLVKVAYFENYPQNAVILNWTSWIFYLLHTSVGLLFITMGFNFIFKKQTS